MVSIIVQEGCRVYFKVKKFAGLVDLGLRFNQDM